MIFKSRVYRFKKNQTVMCYNGQLLAKKYTTMSDFDESRMWSAMMLMS